MEFKTTDLILDSSDMLVRITNHYRLNLDSSHTTEALNTQITAA